MEKTYNPQEKYEVGLSDCCNAPTNTIPASMGDPAMAICSNCNKECKKVWKPMYYKVKDGVYRKIIYKIDMEENYDKGIEIC